MRLGLNIWRQKNSKTKGKLVYYEIDNVSEHMSFLEMMDVLNSELIDKGEEPVAFDHYWRTTRSRKRSNNLSTSYEKF